MTDKNDVLVFGATGNVGGAAARELLRRGWQVRAVSRNPESEKSQALVALGAEVVRADMEDRASLEAAFDGMDRVFSVQNWMTSGVDGEIRQAKLVADVAHDAQVSHLVYGSAGIGQPGTGLAHFENKVVIEQYLRERGLPITIIRPYPFMELMTDKAFYPSLSTWGTMPKVVGWDLPLPWVAVRDIGLAVANAFENPATWIGRDINLISDRQSLRACREMFRAANRKPFGAPLPVAMFKKMAGEELVDMWQWLVDWSKADGPAQMQADLAASREICPQPCSVAEWLARNGNGTKAS